MITDIDECAAGDDECNHVCINTIGSFLCNCSGPGYRLQSDAMTCLSELMTIIHNLVVIIMNTFGM